MSEYRRNNFCPEMRRVNCNPFEPDEGPICVGDFGDYPMHRQEIRRCPGSECSPCRPSPAFCPCCIIKPILDVLNNNEYGLEEIKEEVRIIENAVTHKIYGLEEIKDEVRIIENAVTNKTYGLQSMEAEVDSIEKTVIAQSAALASITVMLTKMQAEILLIMAKLGI